MADPINLDLDAQADGTAQFAAAIEQFAEAKRKAAEADEAAAKAAQQRAAEVARLKQLYGDFAGVVEKTAQRNKQFTDAVANGTYARQAREMATLARQYEKIRRETELTARYGNRVGGFLARNEGGIATASRAATYGATAAVATGTSLVRQGFSGTVEANRLSAEWNMLAREMAGAFKPVIDVTTRAVRGLRQFMETLGPTGQDVVMLGGTALAAGLALKAVAGGGIVGAVGRAALTGGMSLVGTAVASAGGSALGTVAGTAAGGAAAGSAARSGLSATAGRAARAAPGVGLALSAGDAATSGDYGRARAAGKSRLGSAMVAFGAGLADTYYQLAPWEDGNPIQEGRRNWDRKHPPGSSPNGHRMVTLSGGGYDEGGSGYDRIASAIAKVDAERLTGAPENIVPLLERIAAASEAAAAENTKRNSPQLKRPGEP